MSRTNTPMYLTPVDSTGAPVAETAGDTAFGVNCRGVFTLAAGTYFVNLGSGDAVFLQAAVQGDADIAITSATVEETVWDENMVPLSSDVTGQWFATPITMIESAVEGTGWTNTNDVGANSAGNAGGVCWEIGNTGARRMRLKVVVGTAGQARFGSWGKD